MKTYSELSQQASQLRKAKDYSQATPLYAELWEHHQDHLNEWDGWGYAQCLYKQQRYQESLDICRDVYRQHRHFPNISNLYAWNIYHLHIKPENTQLTPTFNKAVDAICKLTTQEDSYSPYILTVFRALKATKEHAKAPYERILMLTDRLNPKKLSDTPNSFTDKTGKQKIFASDLERYYAYRSKALYEQSQWQESIDTCKQALDRFTTFHNNNDIWFNRRIALCQQHIGNT